MKVCFFVHEGFLATDMVGPADLFGCIKLTESDSREVCPDVEIQIVGPVKGPIRSYSGYQVYAEHSVSEVDSDIDVLFLAGALDEQQTKVLENQAVARGLERLIERSRKVAAVCTGSLLLAKLGFLEGKSATTHWQYCRALGTDYVGVNVQSDAIFVKDGKFYTSAGITAGMDLALAIIEEELGRKVALDLAKLFVIYLKRSGGQAQFSSELAVQANCSSRIELSIEWIRRQLHRPIRVSDIADSCNMSTRNFSRRFIKEVGVTPSAFVEKLRTERAKRLLEQSTFSMSEVASKSGFADQQQMRRAFMRNLGILPSDYADRFECSPATRFQNT